VSELIETGVYDLALRTDQNQLQIDVTSLHFDPGEALLYQYRLEGGDRDWGLPTEQRSVDYASLRPGAYRFSARAIRGGGLTSLHPASISFRILPPVWQRWWFLSSAGCTLGLLIYALYQYRLMQGLAVERMRARIATDLHDDIGSSISAIALLSEAVKQQIGASDPGAAEMATQAATMARGLARSMGDLVWSIDPRRDDLNDVITRVRHFASALLESQGIAWSLQGPPDPGGVKLSAEQRRNLFLIFKEGLNNIVRHARCSRTEVIIRINRRELRAEILDDGIGLDYRDGNAADARGWGNGLRNITLRVKELGGDVNFGSNNGCGTRIRFTIPLNSRQRRRSA
jgi:nitrate/nitrite-specific signal transduction histidine kinase